MISGLRSPSCYSQRKTGEDSIWLTFLLHSSTSSLCCPYFACALPLFCHFLWGGQSHSIGELVSGASSGASLAFASLLCEHILFGCCWA